MSLGGAAARAVDHGRVVGRGDRSGAGPIRERARLAPEQKIELLVRVRRELVRVEVSDDGEGFDTVAVPPHPDHAAGGWGLWIVAQLTDRWGIDVSRSTRIWCELETRAGPEPGDGANRTKGDPTRRVGRLGGDTG